MQFVEGGEAIGCREMISLTSGVGGLMTINKKVTVPMDKCVLNIVKCGRCGGEAVLQEVVL